MKEMTEKAIFEEISITPYLFITLKTFVRNLRGRTGSRGVLNLGSD